ncbi:hypothetical protein FIBSPDRAFT_868408, partial [Athelia psychrophila]
MRGWKTDEDRGQSLGHSGTPEPPHWGIAQPQKDERQAVVVHSLRAYAAQRKRTNRYACPALPPVLSRSAVLPFPSHLLPPATCVHALAIELVEAIHSRAPLRLGRPARAKLNHRHQTPPLRAALSIVPPILGPVLISVEKYVRPICGTRGRVS